MGLNCNYKALAMESMLAIVIVTLSSTMDVSPAIQGPGVRKVCGRCARILLNGNRTHLRSLDVAIRIMMYLYVAQSSLLSLLCLFSVGYRLVINCLLIAEPHL